MPDWYTFLEAYKEMRDNDMFACCEYLAYPFLSLTYHNHSIYALHRLEGHLFEVPYEVITGMMKTDRWAIGYDPYEFYDKNGDIVLSLA